MKAKYALALHGGAGTISPGPDADELPYHKALTAALAAGETVLAAGGSAVDAVVATVVALEDCPLFNAGHGAVFNADREHELDAAVMDGARVAAGAVAGARRIRNPVLAAREVMRQGRSVLLGGDGADRFAREHGLEMVDQRYFSTEHRLAQLLAVQEQATDRQTLDHDSAAAAAAAASRDSSKFGTVGAVALDRHGNLAAATSTGGMTNKQPGRIGDSPIVGAGVYANDASCAVSSTGTGEHFIRACSAYDIHARMRYLAQDLDTAVAASLAEGFGSIGGRGGLIAVDRQGNLSMRFNSTGMYRAWVREGDEPRSAIFAA
ncbi:MAG TPA: isoaspartyl peptidase/L-asparaginase [Trinickia sp.]|nr:isoaspartyl peptidase/L-asparaginase [Trinickia sp.]